MIEKKIFYEKHAPQAKFLMKKMRRRQDLHGAVGQIC